MSKEAAIQSGRRRARKHKPTVPSSGGPDAIPASPTPPRPMAAPMLPRPNCPLSRSPGASGGGKRGAACCCWRAAPLAFGLCVGENRIASTNPIRPLASPGTPGEIVIRPAWGLQPAAPRVIEWGPPASAAKGGARRARFTCDPDLNEGSLARSSPSERAHRFQTQSSTQTCCKPSLVVVRSRAFCGG